MEPIPAGTERDPSMRAGGRAAGHLFLLVCGKAGRTPKNLTPSRHPGIGMIVRVPTPRGAADALSFLMRRHRI